MIFKRQRERNNLNAYKFDRPSYKTKKMKNVLINILLTTSVMLVSFAILSLFIFNNEDTFLLGYKPYIISSESMEPTYKKNALVIIKKADFSTIQIGDVIAFKAQAFGNKPAFHRVIDVADTGFITKGDAVKIRDDQIVNGNTFLGKDIWHTNFTASMIPLLQTPRGIINIIILPIIGIVFLILFINVSKHLWAIKRRSQIK